MQALQINTTVLLSSDPNITPHGLSSLPYKLVEWKVIELSKDRVTIQRGKQIHDKYVDTVNDILAIIKLLN